MKLFAISLLFFSVCIFSGCVDENTDSCPEIAENNLVLDFIHIDDLENDLFVDHIHRVDVFVFDNQQRFVTKKTVDKAALSVFAGTELTLAPGTYHLICWGNAMDKTLFSRVEIGDLFSDAFSSNATLNGTNVGTNGDALYYGPSTKDTPALSLSVTVPEQGTVNETVAFCSAHIKLEVYIKGFEDQSAQRALVAPRIDLTPIPSTCDFNMQTSGSDISYSDVAVYQTIENEEVAVVEFYPPLFDKETPIELHVKKQSDGSKLTIIRLKDFIKENNIKITGNTEVVIPILVEYKSVGVSITLPGWGKAPVTPELD